MADSRRCSSIFVRDLHPNTTDDEFLSYFRRECTGVRPGLEGGKIIRDGNGRSKLYGFINFVDASSAKKVVDKKNHVIGGKKVICRIQNTRKKKPPAFNKFKTEPKYLREIHVRNLNISTTNQQLKEYFQKFGFVINAFITLDSKKRSQGYGFVEFQNSSSVDEVQDKRPHMISNKEIQTVRSYPQTVPLHLKKPTTVLFVLNYNEKTEEEDVEEYFGEFGNITLISFHKKKRPNSLEDFKYLEIQFDDYDTVDKICLANFSTNHTINGCTLKVTKCLEDCLDEKPSTSENLNSVGMVATPVPSAPVFPAEELHQSPYNPYFINHQQPTSPPPETQTINPQHESLNTHYANIGPNLYPSLETKSAIPQAAPSVRRPAPPHPAEPQRRERKEDCIIL